MGKIAAFFLFLIFAMMFPVYEYFLQKPVKKIKEVKNMPLVNIYNGKFATYDNNLSKTGYFSSLNVYKKYYLGQNLFVNDLIKKEFYKAKKAKLEDSVMYAYNFFYKNENYSLNTLKAIYFLKKKIFKGSKFFLKGKDFNSSGENFLVDKNKNITAYETIFNLKVNQ